MTDLSITFDPAAVMLFGVVFAWLWSQDAKLAALSSRIDKAFETLTGERPPKAGGG